jgi:hypothetical protein
MFCALRLIFGGSEGAEPSFHVLRFQTSFQRHQGHWFHFSCFALPYTFSALPWASGQLFNFCAPGLVFDGIDGVRSTFHVLRFLTRFRWAWGTLFMFCAPEIIFGGTEGAEHAFHVLRYRGSWSHFSLFWLSHSFSVVPGSLGPLFIFCDFGLIFRRYEGHWTQFSCFALSYSFSRGTEGIGSTFYILRSQTNFRRYRGR